MLICWCLTKILFPSARLIRLPIWVRGWKQIKFGKNLTTGRSLRIDCHYGGELIIGENVEINDNCQIACGLKVEIGNNVLIASKVFITDHDHLFDNNGGPLKKEIQCERVIIGDNVWIGNGVSVLKGSIIPAGSVLATNTVVLRKLTERGVYGGIPCKLLKKL
tara:strand:+ start:209 stop:697 length:489 start_codon:yes stop_codon:yes gene_type:complete